jgi:hypothetical protein
MAVASELQSGSVMAKALQRGASDSNHRKNCSRSSAEASATTGGMASPGPGKASARQACVGFTEVGHQCRLRHEGLEGRAAPVVGRHEVHVQGSHVIWAPGRTSDLASCVRFATYGAHASGEPFEIESPIRESSSDVLDRMDLL